MIQLQSESLVWDAVDPVMEVMFDLQLHRLKVTKRE